MVNVKYSIDYVQIVLHVALRIIYTTPNLFMVIRLFEDIDRHMALHYIHYMKN